jgi:hypothetical protein
VPLGVVNRERAGPRLVSPTAVRGMAGAGNPGPDEGGHFPGLCAVQSSNLSREAACAGMRQVIGLKMPSF